MCVLCPVSAVLVCGRLSCTVRGCTPCLGCHSGCILCPVRKCYFKFRQLLSERHYKLLHQPHLEFAFLHKASKMLVIGDPGSEKQLPEVQRRAL
ncbi:hypothetical protein NDU88_004124 [Pleurodeles waltl]|uniref:Uncharacterized protein n=1 Tax=Pleurodeles waltl TaxID=8319 RepID=A0AAV7NK50_PLEWA|nr:hypothetical protein NDU88_004124 [Pleurodeles waltl]